MKKPWKGEILRQEYSKIQCWIQPLMELFKTSPDLREKEKSSAVRGLQRGSLSL